MSAAAAPASILEAPHAVAHRPLALYRTPLAVRPAPRHPWLSGRGVAGVPKGYYGRGGRYGTEDRAEDSAPDHLPGWRQWFLVSRRAFGDRRRTPRLSDGFGLSWPADTVVGTGRHRRNDVCRCDPPFAVQPRGPLLSDVAGSVTLGAAWLLVFGFLYVRGGAVPVRPGGLLAAAAAAVMLVSGLHVDTAHAAKMQNYSAHADTSARVEGPALGRIA